MSLRPPRSQATADDDTIDVARLSEPDVIVRRDCVCAGIVRLFREIEIYAERGFGEAWDEIQKHAPEIAADIAEVDARLDHIAIEVIGGSRPMEHLDAAAGVYVLYWRRALAALQLYEITCARCGQMNATVVCRGSVDDRLCRRCWIGSTSH
jgi:hypothetical protein